MLRHWLILVFGGLCEAGWAFCLGKSRDGGLWWYAGFALLYILSAVCLTIASRRIPIGTAYAVWTGIGAFCTVAMGIILLREPVTVMRLVCILAIFAAVTGLYLLTD